MHIKYASNCFIFKHFFFCKINFKFHYTRKKVPTQRIKCLVLANLRPPKHFDEVLIFCFSTSTADVEMLLDGIKTHCTWKH